MILLLAEKLLIEADAGSPPAAHAVNPPSAPFSVNLSRTSIVSGWPWTGAFLCTAACCR